jgi:hypothetical protein
MGREGERESEAIEGKGRREREFYRERGGVGEREREEGVERGEEDRERWGVRGEREGGKGRKRQRGERCCSTLLNMHKFDIGIFGQHDPG